MLAAAAVSLLADVPSHTEQSDNSIDSAVSAIEQYEQAGDYSHALEIANECFTRTLNMDCCDGSSQIIDAKARLEQELLSFGTSRLLFDENFQPRPKLLQLLQVLGMEPLDPTADVLTQINGWAQKNLLRQGERWEQQTEQFDALAPSLLPMLEDLGFVHAVPAHFSEYQGALVHGALLTRVRSRLYNLIEQWEQGVRFKRLYFLSGDRPLESDREGKNALLSDAESKLKIRPDWVSPSVLPATESEMVRFVWAQSLIPVDMRGQVEVYFIEAPMKSDPVSGKLVRPTTDDTVKMWLQTCPPPGRYLAISNAPYINRQDLVLRSIVSGDYGFDTIGTAASKQEKMAIYLDEIARLIFQTKQLSQKNKN